jgi:hypothetical protein
VDCIADERPRIDNHGRIEVAHLHQTGERMLLLNVIPDGHQYPTPRTDEVFQIWRHGVRADEAKPPQCDGSVLEEALVQLHPAQDVRQRNRLYVNIYIYIYIYATQQLHRIIMEQKNEINDLQTLLARLEAIINSSFIVDGTRTNLKRKARIIRNDTNKIRKRY